MTSSKTRAIRLTGVSNLDPTTTHGAVESLRIEHATLKSLAPLSQHANLKYLALIGVKLENPASLLELKGLKELILIACPLEDASPIVSHPNVRRVVLRCCPWSSESWNEFLPTLKARLGENLWLPDNRNWLISVTSMTFAGAGTEYIPGRQVGVIFAGADAPVQGAHLIPKKTYKSWVKARQAQDLTEVVQEWGTDGSDWLGEMLSPPPTGRGASEVVASLPQGTDPALLRYVTSFPNFSFPDRPTPPSSALSDAPPPVADLARQLGAWDLPGRPEVGLSGIETEPKAWWRWFPDGAFTASNPGPDGIELWGLATDDHTNLGLFVEINQGDSTRIWQASIEEHEDGKALDPRSCRVVAPDLAHLLDAIVRVRTGNTVVERQ